MFDGVFLQTQKQRKIKEHVFDVVFLQTHKQRTQICLKEKLYFKFTCLNLSLTFKFCKPQFVSPTQFDFCIRRLQPASVLVFNPRSLSSTCVYRPNPVLREIALVKEDTWRRRRRDQRRLRDT
jgi:hypothetical protein